MVDIQSNTASTRQRRNQPRTKMYSQITPSVGAQNEVYSLNRKVGAIFWDDGIRYTRKMGHFRDVVRGY